MRCGTRCPCPLNSEGAQDDLADAWVPAVATMSDEPPKALHSGKLCCPSGDHYTPEPPGLSPKMHQPEIGTVTKATPPPIANSSAALPVQSNRVQANSGQTPIANAVSPPPVQWNRVQVSGLQADCNVAGIPNRIQSVSSRSLSSQIGGATKAIVSYENTNLPGALVNRAGASSIQLGGSEVTLHVYDLHQVTRMTGLPIFHLGVEIYKKEYFFSVDGVVSCPPAGHKKHVHKLTVPLGRTNLSEQQVLHLLAEMRQEWHGGVYNLLSCNCQTFATAFCHRLGLGSCIPPQYCRLGEGGPGSQVGRSGMSWLHPILASTGSQS